MIQWNWHGGDNQRFRLEHLGDGLYKITAKHSGKVLDVSAASPDGGAVVIQWDWHGGNNQRWRF
ncbi:MAG: RICIN domain-containing protein [Chloroflexota bacterium]